MFPVLFKIGGFAVPTFGVLGVLGLLVAIVVQRREAARLGYDPRKVEELVLVSILCAWVGSRGLYILQNPDHPGGLLGAALETGGYVMYGGVITSVPAAFLLARRAGISGARLVDIITPGMTLGLAIGRIGCLAAGCDYGLEAGAPSFYTLTFVDPLTLVPPALRGKPLLPSQPLMALGFLATFAVIQSARVRLTRWPGAVFLLYFVVEPPLRFLVEFTRGDLDRGFLGPVSTSQAFALAATPLAIALFVWRIRCPGTPAPAGSGSAVPAGPGRAAPATPATDRR